MIPYGRRLFSVKFILPYFCRFVHALTILGIASRQQIELVEFGLHAVGLLGSR